MASKRKSWRDKYEARTSPEVQVLSVPFAGMKPGQVMLISTPAEIDGYVAQIPAGQKGSVQGMREELAKKHGAEVTCPATTSILPQDRLRSGPGRAGRRKAPGSGLALLADG